MRPSDPPNVATLPPLKRQRAENAKGRGKKGKGSTSYARYYAGQVGNGAARTDIFLGERHRLASARRPRCRNRDLGPDHYATHTDVNRKARSHKRQLEATATTSSSPPRGRLIHPHATNRILGPVRFDDLKDAEPDTLRYRLLSLSARLERHARARVLEISRTWPWKVAFLACWQLLCALPAPA